MKNHHKAAAAVLAIAMAALVVSTINSVGADLQQAVPEVVAQYTTSAPSVDGSVDAVWATAPAAELKSGLTLQALYDDASIFVLATWPDATMSMTRGGSWSWDGQAWSTDPNSDQGEDRLGILWNINATDFGTSGCMVKCHPPAAYLETPGERADMWHMKAARSLGVLSAMQEGALQVDATSHQVLAGRVSFQGYVDDKYVAQDGGEDAGRYGDGGGSTYGRNRNEDKTGPLYIELDPVDYIDAMILRQEEIDRGEALVVADADAADISTAWDKHAALNAVVPERILRLPEDSRGDVLNAASWSDGVWTAEFQRALVNGNDDDVQFDDLTQPVHFGAAIFDNNGGIDHDISNMLMVLKLAPNATAVTPASWGRIKSGIAE